ncbi:MAG: porin family protein [Chitinophagaceae bacterium]
MKKISLFTLTVLIGLGVFAQDQPVLRTEMAVTPRFGIKAGVNMPTLEIDDDSQTNPLNTNMKTSFNAGVFVNVPLGGNLRFQPELVYNGQGSKVSTTVGASTQNFEYDFHYLSVPLMFQLQSPGGFWGELGPQIGFLLKGEQDGPGSTEVDLKDDMKKTDFSASAGIGYLSRIGLGLGARYNMGFSNIYDADAPNDEGKYKNRVLSFSLYYHFGANK